MRFVAVILCFALALVVLGHSHCLVEICPEGIRNASLGVTDAPAEDPMCETEKVCPAKDDYRRMDSLSLALNGDITDVELAIDVMSSVTIVPSSRTYGLASISHHPPIRILHQTFRI